MNRSRHILVGHRARLAVIACLICATGEVAANSVFFQRQDGVSVYFELESADTPAARNQGLMWRRFLAPRHGMLFDFESSSRIRMWMKNTHIPLDMIFVDEQKKIVFIRENTEPQSLEIIETPIAARYTVEINAGEARRYRLSVGDRVYLK